MLRSITKADVDAVERKSTSINTYDNDDDSNRGHSEEDLKISPSGYDPSTIHFIETACA